MNMKLFVVSEALVGQRKCGGGELGDRLWIFYHIHILLCRLKQSLKVFEKKMT